MEWAEFYFLVPEATEGAEEEMEQYKHVACLLYPVNNGHTINRAKRI